ncbi:hypothetical protein K1Y72_31370 [Actinomadura sp. PM05-2]|uniref:DUF320 domain-containing protein n=2 Tax=Actinomadura parmotrematis TaxID=2864039 RepID=A0ABS7G2F3_9ACTN|nr:hypothetical protein [Actinomadura parmotrematis]
MNTLHKLTIVGFATAGLALAAPAAMADTFHGQGSKAAGPNGASSTGIVSGAVDGHHGHGGGGDHGDGGVFYGKKAQTAGPNGATSSGVVSAAD